MDDSTVRDLLDITRQQRAQIDRLIDQFQSQLSFSSQQPIAGAAQPGAVSGGQLSMSARMPGPTVTTQPAQPLTVSQPVGQHSVSSADLVSGPLTAALSKLSDAIDPVASVKTKGMLLRPEYYVQHKCNGVSIRNLDHTKLSYRELIFGMDSVMNYLFQSGGDAQGYSSHKLFLSGQAKMNKFIDRAYVDYDRFIIDNFIEGLATTFVVGDLLGVAMFFHGGNLLPYRQTPSQNRKRNKRGCDDHEGGGSQKDSPTIFATALITQSVRVLVLRIMSAEFAELDTKLWVVRNGSQKLKISDNQINVRFTWGPPRLVVAGPAVLLERVINMS